MKIIIYIIDESGVMNDNIFEIIYNIFSLYNPCILKSEIFLSIILNIN